MTHSSDAESTETARRPQERDYSTPFVEWTDALLKEVLPQRGDARLQRKQPKIKVQSLYTKAAKVIRENPDGLDAGKCLSSPAAADLLTRVAARFEGAEPETFDPVFEAGSALLSSELCSPHHKPKERNMTRWVYFWIQTFGVERAIEAILTCLRMNVEIAGYASGKSWRLILPAALGSQRSTALWMLGPWVALRSVFACADDAAYERYKVSLIEQATSTNKAWALVRAALVLSEEAEFRATVLEQCKTEDGRSPSVLRDPPWRRKRGKTPVIEFAPLEIASLQRIDAVERARRMQPWRPYGDPRETLDAALERWRGETRVLAQLEDPDEMFDYIQRIDRWTTDPASLKSVITRIGERIDPLLPKLVDEMEVLQGIADYGSVTLVPWVVAAQMRKRTKSDARQWLRRFPSHAAAGLFPLLFGKDKTLRKAARIALDVLVTQEPSVLREVAVQFGKRDGADVERAILQVLDRDPIDRVSAKIRKSPKWLEMDTLPPLTLESGKDFDSETMTVVGEMLSFTERHPAYAGIEQLRDISSAQSRDVFVQTLCSAWIAGGASGASNWALYALGHLGTDDSARWLGKQIHSWAFGGKKARALYGLEVLAMIGSDVALMLIGRWSYHGPAWLKEEASRILARVAGERGLTDDELQDRTAPTLGLTEDGTRVLDYGTRTFTVRLDELLRPLIFDANGERMARIPSVRKTDDKDKAEQAKKSWAALKSDAEKVAKSQLQRLERSMTLGRRWSPQDLSRFVLRHPLLSHVARRLVFTVYDEGAFRSSFRLTEDGTFADESDTPSYCRTRARSVSRIRLN